MVGTVSHTQKRCVFIIDREIFLMQVNTDDTAEGKNGDVLFCMWRLTSTAVGIQVVYSCTMGKMLSGSSGSGH